MEGNQACLLPMSTDGLVMPVSLRSKEQEQPYAYPNYRVGKGLSNVMLSNFSVT